MLFNCVHCGKTVSSKLTSCVYCKNDLSTIAQEFSLKHKEEHRREMKEKYAGTLFGVILKTKIH